jgi:chromosome partitioning protein
MAVFVFASTKGGPGKTTTAACIAHHFLREGHTVKAIDSDPNQNLVKRLSKSEVPVEVVEEEGLLAAIKAAQAEAEIVVVDVAGVLTRGMLYAVAAASVVIIPCSPDRNDVIEAVKTQMIIQQAQEIKGRSIPHAVLLTKVNRRAQVTAETVDQLTVFKVPMFSVDIPMRTAYQQASYTGVPIADKAVQEDIAALADQIADLMGAGHAAA